MSLKSMRRFTHILDDCIPVARPMLILKHLGLFLAVCLPVILTAGAACERPPAPAPGEGPVVVVRNAAGEEWRVKVELARTPAEREQGLMYRWELKPDHGMLFIFDDVKKRTFWMKNTRIPLDLIFITPERTVAGVVENAEPYTLTPRAVDAPSEYVLEVSGGEAARHGLAAGVRVYFLGIEGLEEK